MPQPQATVQTTQTDALVNVLRQYVGDLIFQLAQRDAQIELLKAEVERLHERGKSSARVPADGEPAGA